MEATKKGTGLRIDFRIGRLEIKNNYVSWKQSEEFKKDGVFTKSTYSSINPEENNNSNSKYYNDSRNGSKHKKSPKTFLSFD